MRRDVFPALDQIPQQKQHIKLFNTSRIYNWTLNIFIQTYSVCLFYYVCLFSVHAPIGFPRYINIDIYIYKWCVNVCEFLGSPLCQAGAGGLYALHGPSEEKWTEEYQSPLASASGRWLPMITCSPNTLVGNGSVLPGSPSTHKNPSKTTSAEGRG